MAETTDVPIDGVPSNRCTLQPRARHLLEIAVGMLAVCVCCACVDHKVATQSLTVPVCDASIAVAIDADTANVSRNALVRWISRAGAAVCTYYGAFPLPRPHLHVSFGRGGGVGDGVTYPENGGTIEITVGRDTTPAQLDRDWELTHEMIHLAFPDLPRRNHWLEEGIAVYVEPIARVQAGQLRVEQMWSDVLRDMPQGEPGIFDRGLDHTHSWGRTYWGGALFCLLADVRIRQQTHNQNGLQDALRGILNSGGTIVNDWQIEQALATGDKATGTTVLMDLYKEMGSEGKAIDLDPLWRQLGITRADDGSVHFDDKAPLAEVRAAITRRK